jgi:hypothetical protein
MCIRPIKEAKAARQGKKLQNCNVFGLPPSGMPVKKNRQMIDEETLDSWRNYVHL